MLIEIRLNRNLIIFMLIVFLKKILNTVVPILLSDIYKAYHLMKVLMLVISLFPIEKQIGSFFNKIVLINILFNSILFYTA